MALSTPPSIVDPTDGETHPRHGRVDSRLTVVVPAYNEAACIADTIRSVQAQSVSPKQIIVVDDSSIDGTGDIARSLGVMVLRPTANSGSKGGALNLALRTVATELVVTIDADTTLAPDAIELLLPAFDDPKVGVACGFVIPRRVRTVWEGGRYIEYLLTLTFHKPLQDYYDKVFVASGCFSAYRTDVLRELGGWSARTVAEDMDLTWGAERAGWLVRFIPQAVCYPLEPNSFKLLRRQLRRWTHGFMQNVRVYGREVLEIPYLRSLVALALWEAVVATLFFLVLLPVLFIATRNPLFLLGYLMDAPVVAIPVCYGAIKRRECRRALVCFPAYFLLRAVSAFFFVEALWSELIVRKPLTVFEKGH